MRLDIVERDVPFVEPFFDIVTLVDEVGLAKVAAKLVQP